jgi:hypothetical protein
MMSMDMYVIDNGAFHGSNISIYIVEMINLFCIDDLFKMRLIRQRRETKQKKWLHLFSTGIEMKPLIIIVNCAQELFED